LKLFRDKLILKIKVYQPMTLKLEDFLILRASQNITLKKQFLPKFNSQRQIIRVDAMTKNNIPKENAALATHLLRKMKS
jgi:hypothetical protein